jgi:hypothetical protein
LWIHTLPLLFLSFFHVFLFPFFFHFFLFSFIIILVLSLIRALCYYFFLFLFLFPSNKYFLYFPEFPFSSAHSFILILYPHSFITLLP